MIDKVLSFKGLKEALKGHQNNEITYDEFLVEANKCGVTNFLADIEKQTVTYFNSAKSEFHVQQVPEWK